MATEEKRSNARYPVKRTVQYETGVSLETAGRSKSSRGFKGHLCDISTGGICLTTTQRLKPFTVIQIAFPPSVLPPMPPTLAEVRWVRPNRRKSAYRVGTSFLLSPSF